MVKKSSGVKSKKAGTSVEEKIESLSSESLVKEAPPQVMQVVEVTEEEVKEPKEEIYEEMKDDDMTHTEIVDDAAVPVNEKTQEEKHQEVVSEFFAKKEKPSSFGYPNISVHKKSPVAGVFLWALGVVAIVVLIGFAIVSFSRGGVTMPKLLVKATPTPTLAPTAIPTPAVDKKSLTVQILNGSGTAGVAGKMKALLEEKGYTVSGTGNAKTYDYEKTEIQVKAEKEAFLLILQSDLSGSYVVGSATATLKGTATYDAVVIIGKE